MDNLKEHRYQKLIEAVREKYLSDKYLDIETDKKLYWFDACHEINLWTYWQGRNNLDAKILLVGQDWGNPWDASCDNFIKKLSCVGADPMDIIWKTMEALLTRI